MNSTTLDTSTVLDAVRSADWHIHATAAVTILLVSVYASEWFGQLRLWWLQRKYPVINPGWGAKAQQFFNQNCEQLILKGSNLFKGRPFMINDFTQSGAKLILDPKYIDEIKNNPAFSFSAFVYKDFYAGWSGFEPFGEVTNSDIFQTAVRKELSQVLSLTIAPMASILPSTLELVVGPCKDWTEHKLLPVSQRAISRLTSRVFFGTALMDNPEWQSISIGYVNNAFHTARLLNQWPKIIRPLVHLWLPESRGIRSLVRRASEMIQPILDERMAEMRENGGPRRRVLDSVDWFVASMKGNPMASKFNLGAAEISLSLASIHTTARTYANMMVCLLKHPEYIPELREEVIQVVKETRKLDKLTLYNLKKMDSFLRESMRVHPGSLANLRRMAVADVTLSDGTFIPKNTYVTVGPLPMQDPKIYPNPEEFQPWRFLKLRTAPGAENKYQAVTTSPDFIFFGHGQHACPGRFFAGNEIKLLFAYMLLNYDFKLPGGPETLLPEVLAGLQPLPNPAQGIMIKARTPEIDLLEFVEFDEQS